MKVGEVEIQVVLKKIAKGEYLKVFDDMDEFIKVFASSKHGSGSWQLKEFILSIEPAVLSQINPGRHSSEVVQFLCQNVNLQNNSNFSKRLRSACIKLGITTVLK